MRQSIIYSLIVSANLVDAVVEGSVFGSGSDDDWKGCVKDQKKNLEELGSQTVEDVKGFTKEQQQNLGVLGSKVAEAWPTLEQKPWWKFWSTKPYGTFSWGSGRSHPLSDWLFETWSVDGLRKFLKEHGVETSPQATKEDLVQSAKENYNSVAKNLENSKFLPDNGYFKHWTREDFKRWLKEYQIPFEDKEEELLEKVRENIYHVSKNAEKKRLETLNSLNLASKQLLDKAGDIKEDVFNSWSAEELQEWLNSHRIAYSDELVGKRDELAALAKDRKDLLKDDIRWYLNAVKTNASPFLEKSPEYVASVWERTLLSLRSAYDAFKGKADNLINDTFLVDLDSWPREKLIDYLEARGVSYSSIATDHHLRRLAREFRNRPLKKAQKGYEKVADGEWFHGLKGWARGRADEVQNSEVYNALHDGFQALGKDTQDWASGVGKKVHDDFNSWSSEDLRAYLKNFGSSVSSATMSKDDLVRLVKEKTSSISGIQRKPWYAKWAYNTKNWFSRALGLVVKN